MLPAYAQIPRGRNSSTKPIRYERWPEFYEDVVAALDHIVARWPKTLLRPVLLQVCFEEDSVRAFGDSFPERTLSPADLAELILAQFLVANARARGYLGPQPK